MTKKDHKLLEVIYHIALEAQNKMFYRQIRLESKKCSGIGHLCPSLTSTEITLAKSSFGINHDKFFINQAASSFKLYKIANLPILALTFNLHR